LPRAHNLHRVERYRIGIVGAGFGAIAHLPALLAHPRFEVVALASPSSAARIARERGVPHAFGSAAAMLAGCALDAVTVASPPFAHRDDVLASLAAGKHVICEKPFALDVAGARAMVDAASAAGTACGVAHEFRFVPQAQALKELIANGHLDPLRDLEITLLRSMLRREALRPRGWWFERERGGGVAGANLSHLIDESSWLAGRRPQRSLGLLRTANAQRHDEQGAFESNVDDGAFALIDYGEGLVARLCADATTDVESYTCAAHGEDRTAVASGPNITEVALFTIDRDETSELECKPSPYARYAAVNANVPLLMELYDEFVKRIERRPNALPTFEEALATQQVLESIGYHP
jgi:predicted dehydrogenase